jgi:hypothetical protein
MPPNLIEAQCTKKRMTAPVDEIRRELNYAQSRQIKRHNSHQCAEPGESKLICSHRTEPHRNGA